MEVTCDFGAALEIQCQKFRVLFEHADVTYINSFQHSRNVAQILVTRARSGKFTPDVPASPEIEGLEFWAESEDSNVP